MKYAILSMDIEDWYHLDYFRHKDCDRHYSFLDGVNRFQEIIEEHALPATFFVVGELINALSAKLKELDARGYDIAVHGWSHTRPMTMDTGAFREDADCSKKELEGLLGKRVAGYRAPCFSMDRERLDILQESGFQYDSSRILFDEHPLYEEIDCSDFQKISDNIFRLDDFFEFEASTLKLIGRHIPVSGGGYLRIFPWVLTQALLKRYVPVNDFYMFYIHPFELSCVTDPPFPSGTRWKNKLRFSLGRSSVGVKLQLLIEFLRTHGFEFTTFSSLREKLLNGKTR